MTWVVWLQLGVAILMMSVGLFGLFVAWRIERGGRQ